MNTSKIAADTGCCSFCHGDKSDHLHVIRGLNIVQCTRCGLIYTSPRLSWDYAASAGDFETGLETYRRSYWPARHRSAEKVWNELEHYRHTGKLLDVGCSYGFFLNEAQRRDWQVVGVEPAEKQAAWGRQHFGLQVVETLESPELEPHSFDVITLWDVIEHIEDPRSLLQHCHTLLRPGGVLLVKTPNAEGLHKQSPWWMRPYLHLYWQLIYPSNPMQHLYHFTPQFMMELLQETGFSIVMTDKVQDWGERPIAGRNPFITAVRYPLMWIAWRLQLPYEMLVLAEPQ